MYEGSLCICCMSIDNLSYLFITRVVNNVEENYAKMLTSCFDIELSKLNGHDLICKDCILKLKDCLKFKKRILEVISKLTSFEELSKEIITVAEITESNYSENNKLNTEPLENTDGECCQKASERNVIIKTSPSLPVLMPKKRGRPRIHQQNVLPYKINKNERKCRECAETFPNYFGLMVHYNKHFGNHVCDVCDKRFITYASLKKHFDIHKKGPFPCIICGKQLNTLNTLRSHIQFKHGSGAPFKCCACAARFPTIVRRLHHERAAHGIDDKPHLCKICGRKFSYSGELHKHVALHHEIKIQACPHCNFKSRSDSLRKHLIVKHGVGRGYSCSMCARVCATPSSLKTHMNIHNNIRRFVCKLCSKDFVHKHSLKCHVQTHVSRMEYNGHADDLITTKKCPDEAYTGMLQDLQEESLDESFLSDDLEIGEQEDTDK